MRPIIGKPSLWEGVWITTLKMQIYESFKRKHVLSLLTVQKIAQFHMKKITHVMIVQSHVITFI